MASRAKVGLIEFYAQIDTTQDQRYLDFARRGQNFELSANGFGMVAAGLSLYSTMRDANSPVRARSRVGEFAMAPQAQILAAFAGAYEATYDFGAHLAGRANSGAGTRVLSSVFGNNPALKNAVATNATPVARSIASRSWQVAARAAGVAGALMNGMMAYEGYEREDDFMLVGNSLMAVGALILVIPGVNVVAALIAAAAIAIGFIVSLASKDDVQRWVHEGFWGKHDVYWGDERFKIERQIVFARSIANVESVDFDKLNKYFEAELATYIDLNADLRLVDSARHDGRIEIQCPIIQEPSDISKVEVSAWQPTGMFSQFYYPRVRKEWVSPGLVHAYFSDDRATGFPVEIDVYIDRSHNGKITGKLSSEIRIKGKDLW